MNAMAWAGDLRSREGLQRQLAANGPRLVAGILILAIAAQAALLLTAQPAAAPVAPVPGTASAAALTRPGIDLPAILNAHLFGVVAPKPVSSSDAPQTSLPLVIAGLITARDPQQGSAIIGGNASTAKLVNVGGLVEGGARLHAVYADRVVLERGGALETLLLPKQFTMSGSTAAPAAGGATRLPATPTPGQRLQNIAGNSTLFNGLARVQAVLTQGKLTGYRLFPGGPNSAAAFVKMGLMPADMLTAVNGTPLDDPTKSADVLSTLASAASASVTVVRNGSPLEVNLNLATVADLAESAIAADQAAAVAAAANRAPAGANRGGNAASGATGPAAGGTAGTGGTAAGGFANRGGGGNRGNAQPGNARNARPGMGGGNTGGNGRNGG